MTKKNAVANIFKYLLSSIVLLIILFNVYAIASGKTFVYQVLRYTIFKGRMGPDINQYTKDPLAMVVSTDPIEIPAHIQYNKKNPSQDFEVISRQLGTTAYVVIQNDSVLYEYYNDGYTRDSLSNSFSMAKTFVGLLVGCALKDGAIKNLEEPIGNYLPWFDKVSGKTVKIKDLLTMSSGINFTESYLNPFGFAAEILYGNQLKKTIQGYHLTGIPGGVFDYQSGNTQLLSYVLEAAVKKSLAQYASEKLWQPLHATKPAFWSLDQENGDARAFCCFNSTARDFAKIGMLMMHFGKLYDKQIIDSTYLKEAFSPAKYSSDPNKTSVYGYHTWMLRYRNHKVFYARGILGQYIFCIPDKKMVIVRLGHKRSSIKIGDHPVDAYTYLRTGLSLTE